MDIGKEESWKGKEGKDGVVEESWREEGVGWIWVKRNRVGRERRERMGWLRKAGEMRKKDGYRQGRELEGKGRKGWSG